MIVPKYRSVDGTLLATPPCDLAKVLRGLRRCAPPGHSVHGCDILNFSAAHILLKDRDAGKNQRVFQRMINQAKPLHDHMPSH